MKKLENLKKPNRNNILSIINQGNTEDICNALIWIVFNENDWKWCQDLCLTLLRNNNSEISGLAATCFGHIARIHRELDKNLVVKELKSNLLNPNITGQVQDALDDVEMYLGKK